MQDTEFLQQTDPVMVRIQVEIAVTQSAILRKESRQRHVEGHYLRWRAGISSDQPIRAQVFGFNPFPVIYRVYRDNDASGKRPGEADATMPPRLCQK
jgi:hypothetical protein